MTDERKEQLKKYHSEYHREWQKKNPQRCAEYSKRHYDKSGSSISLYWYNYWTNFEKRVRKNVDFN